MKKKIGIIIIAIMLVSVISSGLIAKKYKINDKTNETIAIFLDKEKTRKIPKKEDNYLFSKYECSDDSQIKWNELTWKMELSNFSIESKCNLYFITKEVQNDEKIITFNDGNYTSNIKLNNNDNITLPNNPSKVGYTFIGWFTEQNGGKKVTNETKVSELSSGNIYAHWNANNYTVTFNSNGGGTPNPSTKSVTYNSTYGDLPSVSRSGYTFDGWYTQASGGTKITKDSKMTTTQNHSLFAHWNVVNYSISYTLNGGSASNPTSYNINNNTITLTNPTRTGYTFSGWSGSGSGKSVTIPKGSTGNKSYTANWSANTYTVKFMGGLSGNTSFEVCTPSQTFTYDAAKNLQKFGCSTEYSNNIEYVFAGWSDSPNGSVKYSDQQSVKNLATSGTKTLYASYKFSKYIVSGEVNSSRYNYPSQVNKIVCDLNPEILRNYPQWEKRHESKTFTRSSGNSEYTATSSYNEGDGNWEIGCSARISVDWSTNRLDLYSNISSECVYNYSCTGTVS